MAVRTLLACLVAVAACGGDELAGPWDELPLDGTIEVGLTERVDVARDRSGMTHVRGRSLSDLAFVQGYVTARDRLVHMDVLRRLARGTLAKLYGRREDGTLDGAIVDADIAMRTFRLVDNATTTWQEMGARAERDIVYAELVEILTRYAAGVNRYAADLQAGTWSLAPELARVYRPELYDAWEPLDSLLVMRLYALSMSNTLPFELELTDLYQQARATYEPAVPPADPDLVAREGISRDLLALVPVGAARMLDDFPNHEVDTGTRSNDAGPSSKRAPAIPPSSLASAHSLFASLDGALPPGALSSSSFVVDPSRTGDTSAFLATDLATPPRDPDAFYPTHVTLTNVIPGVDGAAPTEEVELDLVGLTLPGIPLVLVGTNGTLAWAPSPSHVDLNDIYRETVVGCAISTTGTCAVAEGGDAAIDHRIEHVQIGRLGQVVEEYDDEYLVVADHGPVLPVISADHRVERPIADMLSIRFASDRATHELVALYRLARTSTISDAFAALGDADTAGLSWMFLDRERRVAWSQHAAIPQRQDGVYQWDATANPDAPAPFFVLDGTGGQNWDEGGGLLVESRYIPHAIAAPNGALVATGADPVGVTFDGNPLNQVAMNDAPLYIGVAFDNGLRQARLAALLGASGSLSAVDIERIQVDAASNAGADLAPRVVEILGFVDAPAAAPPDTQTYLASLAAPDRERLRHGRGLLASWSASGYDTALSNLGSAAGGDVRSAAATVTFSTWMHFFLAGALADELAAFGTPWTVARLGADRQMRIAHALLVDPTRLVQGPAGPILCDRMTVAGADSCPTIVLRAMLDAIVSLEATYATADDAAWSWGDRHALSLSPLLPGGPVATPVGFPVRGDTFAVASADSGWDDLEFTPQRAPAYRLIAESCVTDTTGLACPPGTRIRLRWTFAGGAVFDPRSRHATDLLPDHAAEVHRDVPYELAEIVANGETRWEFR